MDYFLARYYSSAQGRFTSAEPLDPVLGKQGANHSPEARSEFDRYLSNPQHWNRYPYVLNNPLSLVDPDGLDEGTIEVRVNVIWDENSHYSAKEKKAILDRYVIRHLSPLPAIQPKQGRRVEYRQIEDAFLILNSVAAQFR